MNLLKKYLKIRNNFNYFFQFYLEGCAFYFNKIDLNKKKLLSQFLPNFGLNLLKLSIFKSNFLLMGYFFICLYWIVPERLQALELIDDFQFHGFFTQRYFLTSDNRIFGESDSGGSFDFTEAGLNASWAFSADLRVAGQVLFRRAGSGHDYDVEVDFLSGEYGGTTRKHRTQKVQDMLVRKARGSDLVFTRATEISLSGSLPDGGVDQVRVRVASIAPFLVMKAMALSSR